MARSRNIKPGFFMNDQLAEVEPLGRILFAGLWCIADREGRLEDRPKRIKAEVLPYDNCDVDDLLNQLAKHEFIIRYEVDGELYIQVANFTKHQNPHKNEATSTIPAPDYSNASTIQVPEQLKKEQAQNADAMGSLDSSGTSTVQAPDKHSTNPADSLNMIPDSLNMIPTTSSAVDELESGRRQIFATFEQELGQPLSSFKAEQINNWLNEFSPEMVILALKIAILGNNRSFKYIDGILLKWKAEGVKTVADAEERERKFQEAKLIRAGPGNKRTTADQNAQVLEAVFGAEA